MKRKALNAGQQAIIEAVDAGTTAMRDLMAETGYSSTSVVKYNLERLAELGYVALVPRGSTLRAYSGRDFCAAWDLAARLCGNPEA